MCRLIFLSLVVGMVLLGVILFVLFYYLPWYIALPIAFAIFLSLPFLAKFVLKRVIKRFVGRLATGLLGTKSGALKGASADIHSVTPTAAPSRPAHELETVSTTAGSTEILTPNDYYLIDVTITPRNAAHCWEPGELLLVPFDADISPEQVLADEDVEGWQADEVRLFRDGQFAPDDAGKYPGPQRLEFLFSLPPSAPRRLKFRYYLETFGDVQLPPR